MLDFTATQTRIDQMQYAFIENIKDMGDNELTFKYIQGVVSNQPVQDEFSDNKRLNTIFKDTREIQIAENAARYVVRFDNYIAFSVINESYADGADLAPPISGHKLRVYEQSHFLNYAGASTFATHDYPGVFRHYQFISLNHIVNVASCDPPRVFLI